MAGMQVLGLIFIWWACATTIRPQTRASALILLATLVLFLLTHFEYSFLFTHDYFFAAVGMAALLRFAPAIAPPRSWRGWSMWGFIGGIATLTAPILASVWLIISLSALQQARRGVTIAA